MNRYKKILALLLGLLPSLVLACQEQGVVLQVLGSGAPGA